MWEISKNTKEIKEMMKELDEREKKGGFGIHFKRM